MRRNDPFLLHDPSPAINESTPKTNRRLPLSDPFCSFLSLFFFRIAFENYLNLCYNKISNSVPSYQNFFLSGVTGTLFPQ